MPAPGAGTSGASARGNGHLVGHCKELLDHVVDRVDVTPALKVKPFLTLRRRQAQVAHLDLVKRLVLLLD